MARSNASQGSRADARPVRDRWPRVGVKLEGGKLVVRELADGERSDAPRAVRIAEPCKVHRTLREAVQAAAESLAASLRKQAVLPVEVACA